MPTEAPDPQAHPFLDPAFAIRWASHKPDYIVEDIGLALERAQANLQAISEAGDAPTFENTVLALDEATRELSEGWGRVGHLDSVNNSPELRKVYNEMLPQVSEFYTRIYLDEALYTRLATYAKSEEAGKLQGAHKRLLEETLEDFRESGAELDAEGKKELESLNAALAAKTQKYSENVLDATNAWSLEIQDEAQLAGLPTSAREAARAEAERHGLGSEAAPCWRFTLHMPSLLPLLTYADRRELREQAWKASNAVGCEGERDNTELVWDILELRHRKAQLLGKERFADYTTGRRMAGSGAKAMAFIEDLHARTKEAFDQEWKELSQWAGEQGAPALEAWDVAYWSEKLRKERYDFDEEDLRPYFPIDAVIQGLFQLVERLFGVRIQARDDFETWHEEVKTYDLLDADGTQLGSFYADWHPRESKRGGAWMNHFRTGGPGKDGFEPHLGLICGNLTPAVGDKPALLTHREVETIFHEFGHLLHHLLGEIELKPLNGIAVVWDFVELPSQIMENWCWERESLDLFARHHESGEPIPQELFEKMQRAKNFQSAMAMMRQLSFGRLDLGLHMQSQARGEQTLDAIAEALTEGYSVCYPEAKPTMVRRFGHLFSDATGYAAGYYSYKWAEVLDADAFTRFQKEGIMNADTGMAFRREILSKGNSAPAEELYRNFMGRDPDLAALLERSGIT